MPEADRPAGSCPSCATELAGRFCASCGERARTRRDLTVRALAGQFLGELFNLDGRLWRSLWLLAARPGFLAAEYVRGARVPYMRPVQIFLVANLAYFLLQPLTIANAFNTTLGSHLERQEYSSIVRPMIEIRLQESGEDGESYRQRFDVAADGWARSLIILLVALLVPLFALAQARGRRLLAEHAVFALHFTSYVLVFVSLLLVWTLEAGLALYRAAGGDPGDVPAPTLDVVILLANAWWIVRGFRTFYANRLANSLLVGVLTTLFTAVPIFGYRFLLFLVTYWTV